jgi:hypothetical protein
LQSCQDKIVERELEPKKRKRAPGHPETHIEGDTKPRGTVGIGCLTCSHPRRSEIEAAILEGMTFRQIAIRFTDNHPGAMPIKKHAQDCIPEIMERRRAKIQEPDELTADLVTAHLKRALARADESSELSFEQDEHDVPREAAQGRSAAIRAHVDTVRAAGEIVGLFKSGTKVEILLKAPETQEFLTKLVELLCPHCALLLQAELDKSTE